MSEPTKEQIEEQIEKAYKSYLDGNRAPWVQGLLAAAYISLKAESEALKEQAAKDVVRMAGASELIAARDKQLSEVVRPWREALSRVRHTLSSHAYTGYKDVAEAIRCADALLSPAPVQGSSSTEKA